MREEGGMRRGGRRREKGERKIYREQREKIWNTVNYKPETYVLGWFA